MDAVLLFCAIAVGVWIGRWSVLHDSKEDREKRHLERVKTEWLKEDWNQRLARKHKLKKRFEGRGGGAA